MIFLLSALAQDVPVEEAVDETVESTGPDRSTPPAVLDPEPVDLQELTSVEIKPGLTLHHVRVPRLRDVSMEIHWHKGAQELGFPEAQVDLTSALWATATESYDEATLSALEDTLDLELGSSISSHSAVVDVQLPLDAVDKGWEMLEQAVLHPVFDKRVLTRTQENLERYYLLNGPTSADSVVFAAARFLWFPKTHPEGMAPDLNGMLDGSHKSLPPVMQALQKQGPVDIVVVGDLPLEDAEAQVRKRFSSLGAVGERAEPVAFEANNGHRVYAISMPASEQVAILHRREAPTRTHADNRAMNAIEYALGGHFLARFNKNLREEKGWTYGVGAWYSPDEKWGSYNVSVDVPKDKMAEAVGELQKEFATLVAEGVTAEEIQSAWRSDMKNYNDTRATTSSAAGVYRWLMRKKTSNAERLTRIQQRRETTPEETQELAQRVLAEKQGIWLFVGPEEQLKSELEELGWEAKWVTPEQAIVGRFPRD